jgi:hypothetical protein
MGAHVLPSGWQVAGPVSESLRFEEFASVDLDGQPLDLSRRNPAARQLSATEAAAQSAATVLAGVDGWDPQAETQADAISQAKDAHSHSPASPKR